MDPLIHSKISDFLHFKISLFFSRKIKFYSFLNTLFIFMGPANYKLSSKWIVHFSKTKLNLYLLNECLLGDASFDFKDAQFGFRNVQLLWKVSNLLWKLSNLTWKWCRTELVKKGRRIEDSPPPPPICISIRQCLTEQESAQNYLAHLEKNS